MNKRYPVHLTDAQTAELDDLIHTGTHPARQLARARILLLADQGLRDADIASAVRTTTATVQRTRQRFVQEGLPAALNERPRPGRPPLITGEIEGHLIMLACSPAPPGHARWTLHLLADQLVCLDLLDTISPEAVRQRLQQNDLKPWLHKQWCIPEPGARFVAKMEDVLAVYTRPYDPARPVVCVDEASTLLHADTRPPRPPAAGQVAQRDYEYVRQGTANLFLWVEPLAGRRGVQVTAQRTTSDFAWWLRRLVEEQYPQAEQIVLVSDNLNTHGSWALYEAFAPQEAARLASKLEWHYTPEHGSWLNMAEIEISALRTQCLARRLASQEVVTREVAAWEQERNAAEVSIDWQFTTADARIKLKHLYPVLKPKPAWAAATSQN
jgi:transposase